MDFSHRLALARPAIRLRGLVQHTPALLPLRSISDMVENFVTILSKVIANAVEGLELNSVKFFLVARSGDEPKFEAIIIKASDAEFVFIDKKQDQDK